MLNSLESSQVKQRYEVEAHRDGYRGVITIPGWGTRHTTIVDTQQDASVLLARLKHEIFGTGSFNGGISDAQRAEFQAAIDAKHVNIVGTLTGRWSGASSAFAAPYGEHEIPAGQ